MEGPKAQGSPLRIMWGPNLELTNSPGPYPSPTATSHSSFQQPKEGEGTQALLHAVGALPSASEVQTQSKGCYPPPGLADFLTFSKPPSSLRKARERKAKRKHAASVRNEDYL